MQLALQGNKYRRKSAREPKYCDVAVNTANPAFSALRGIRIAPFRERCFHLENTD